MPKVLDIKQNKWGIGGEADTNNALHVYGDIISTNLSTLITNASSLKASCDSLVDKLTVSQLSSGSKAANSTSWVYTGISCTLDAGDIIAYGSAWNGSACKGLRFSSSSTSSGAGSTTEAYTTSVNTGPNVLMPIGLFVGTNGTTRYLWTLRAEAKTTTDSFHILKIGHP